MRRSSTYTSEAWQATSAHRVEDIFFLMTDLTGVLPSDSLPVTLLALFKYLLIRCLLPWRFSLMLLASRDFGGGVEVTTLPTEQLELY